jgi:hypothetical protein
VVLAVADAERTILSAIEGARAAAASCEGVELTEVIVSEGRSSDGTRDVARAAGVRVVECPIRGSGAVAHWGIAAAESADWVLVADGDGGCDMASIPALVDAARHAECDLVLGSRARGTVEPGAMSFQERRIAGPVLNLMLRVLFGIRTTDSRAPMRLVRRDLYAQLNMRSAGIEWTTEHVVKSHYRNARIREAPARALRADPHGRRGLKRRGDGWRHLRAIIMLAPRTTLLLPAAAIAAFGAWHWGDRPDTAAACIAVAYLLVLMMLGLQMILHGDRVKPSRGAAVLYGTRASEIAFLWAGIVLAAGVWLLADPHPRLPPSSGPLLLVLGTATVLGNTFWDTIATHLVADLDRAWTDVL